MVDPVSVSSVTAFVRTILDGGWRLGLLALLMGGSIWVADAAGIPRPGVFKEWVPWAAASTLLGLAAILAAVIVLAGEKIQSIFEARREGKDALANLSTLTAGEAHLLLTALRRLPSRFDCLDDAICDALMAKKIFRLVSTYRDSIGRGDRALWEIHPSVAAKKDEVVKMLDGQLAQLRGRA